MRLSLLLLLLLLVLLLVQMLLLARRGSTTRVDARLRRGHLTRRAASRAAAIAARRWRWRLVAVVDL